MSDFDVLLPLRTGGSRTPLFCIHPGFALGWTYAALCRHLGPDQPVYAIQARGIATDEELPKTFDDVVEDYLRQVRAVRPQGPYRLLGWSFGGLVAHALATRLQAQGELIELLALLDTSMVDPDELPPDPAEERVLIERETVAVRRVVPDSERLVRIVGNFISLREQFVPERYAGDILLFTAALEPDRPEPILDPWLPWTEGTVHQHLLECNHMDMMNARDARVIGTRLAAVLAAADK